jgi:hypothetical protein
MHICDGHGFIEDEEGRELAGDVEAREEAIAAVRDIMAGDLRNGLLDLTSFIEVEDETGTLLFAVTFAEAVTLAPAASRPMRPAPG